MVIMVAMVMIMNGSDGNSGSDGGGDVSGDCDRLIGFFETCK